MAELKLNTTTSIVDFLKSQGKPSDFRSREKMFGELGMADRLGTFVGSGSQNLALLRRLQTDQSKTEAPVPAIETKPAEPTLPPQLEGIVPPGTSAADALKTLGIPEVPTAADLTKQVFESPEFGIFREKQELAALTQQASAEAKKAGLEATTVADIENLENKLATRGLAFSGIRGEAVKGLIDSLAASKLAVDRETASRLLNQNLDLKEEILKTVTKTVEDAKKGNKDDISTLEKIGFTVLPGGQIVQTLAGEAAERAREKATKVFETRTIGDRVIRFEFDDKGNVVGKTDLGPGGEAGFTRGEKNALTFDGIAIRAAQDLEKGRGKDGFFDPQLFMKYREEVKNSTPTFLDDFDKKFANNLNPSDAKKLGVTQEDLDPFEEIRRRAQEK